MKWPPRIGILDIYSTSEWRAWPTVFEAMQALRDPLELFSVTEDVVMETWESMEKHK